MMELPSMTMSFMEGPPAARRTGHKISGYSIPAFPPPYKRKARRRPLVGTPADWSAYSAQLIVKAVEPFTPPAPLPPGRVQPQGHIGARRQRQAQAAQGPAAPNQFQLIPPRRQKGEQGLPRRPPHPAVASLPRTQGQAVLLPGAAHQYPDRTQGKAGGRAEVFLPFPRSPQAEWLSGDYCSSFALTRYWPPVTPPKRY